MVACDQPFDEVDKPEFRRLLEYTHLRPSLHIPHRHAMKSRIMKMGEDTIEGIKRMITVCFVYTSHNLQLLNLRHQGFGL
jgi:hypothetical protein